MDKAESITTVDDAVKKLILLDSKDKIWTQEMLLQVTDKAVRLLDADTEVGIQVGRQKEVLQRRAKVETSNLNVCPAGGVGELPSGHYSHESDSPEQDALPVSAAPGVPGQRPA